MKGYSLLWGSYFIEVLAVKPKPSLNLIKCLSNKGQSLKKTSLSFTAVLGSCISKGPDLKWSFTTCDDFCVCGLHNIHHVKPAGARFLPCCTCNGWWLMCGLGALKSTTFVQTVIATSSLSVCDLHQSPQNFRGNDYQLYQLRAADTRLLCRLYTHTHTHTHRYFCTPLLISLS